MLDEKDNHLASGPLTENEIREFRAMIDCERKISWAWAFVKRTLFYIASIAAALVAFRNDILEIFKWLRG